MSNFLRRSYITLERNVPQTIKDLIPVSWRIGLGYRIKTGRSLRQFKPKIGTTNYPLVLRENLELPVGQDRDELFNYLAKYHFKDAGSGQEMAHYLDAAFERFLLTLQLVPDISGQLLEIGAGPYFMTLLLQKFRHYELTLVNYFGRDWAPHSEQVMIDAEGGDIHFPFDNFNVEEDTFPYSDQSFDTVLLCEVLEHFTNNPLHALLEIKRVLKPGGTLILTTPNVARLENIARLIVGENLYDPYSGYGPLGRHNREYTPYELEKLLQHAGFKVDRWFTSDVHHNLANHFVPIAHYQHLVQQRAHALGQYIFVKANSISPTNSNPKKPIWLYRSYPPGEMTE